MQLSSDHPFSLSFGSSWGGRVPAINVTTDYSTTYYVLQIYQSGIGGWSPGSSTLTGNREIGVGSGIASYPSNNYLYSYVDNHTLDVSSVSSSYFTPVQFISFLQSVPSQIQYHSVLSYPHSDLHNRYFIVNDRFYWLSLYINTVFTTKQVNFDVHQGSADATAVVDLTNTFEEESATNYDSWNTSGVIQYQDRYYYPMFQSKEER